ncbi:serine protease Do [Methylomagnum ishizawai]|uniref:Probable periplasmic serine endoprotease DegP-like n=1 Tax=Methylomagnum ishizawai TaxID=1760988 RepID=A0A1Y6CRS4_9GAMM|nr:DegQ family serine endoprotease [Methylomagnum ishizawai]SMF93329.1 serine protease Do [Methylomagnum ishizawai]
MPTQTLRHSLIAAAIAGVLVAGYARFGGDSPQPASATATPPAQIAAAPVPAAAPTVTLPDFGSIVRQSSPAVVNISVSGTTKVSARDIPQLDPNDPFSQFFRRFQPPQAETPMHGMGSGFIVRPDGVILTNAHVVEGASEVTVKLVDKREFSAKVVGVDKPTDTAVLKIEAQDLPTLKLGSPTQTGVGDWVLAIGSPFGFENSVTAGIVSAKSRSLPEEGYVPFIQTDVAVNPGNSGGPLLNTQGEVIGINSQIYSRTGGYQGLSFAIPIDVALKVEQQLLDHGKVSRGRLGVGVQDMNQALADSFGLSRPEGALVDMVPEDGPAARAGVKAGDIIVALNGQPIHDSRELPPLVADLKPGSEAKLTLWRDGQNEEVALKVGELQEPAQASAEPTEAKGRLGLAVRPLSPEEHRQADIKGGLVVERVAGPAAKAGIAPGDVVLAVNGQPINDAGQLRELAAKAGKHLALLIQRGEATMFVPLDLG